MTDNFPSIPNEWPYHFDISNTLEDLKPNLNFHDLPVPAQEKFFPSQSDRMINIDDFLNLSIIEEKEEIPSQKKIKKLPKKSRSKGDENRIKTTAEFSRFETIKNIKKLRK